MTYRDAIDLWIWRVTGRTADQHAADPVPAAAHLPASLDGLRCAREHLVRAVDAMRTQLINAEDLTGPAQTVSDALSEVSGHVTEYDNARIHIDKLINDPDRLVYVATHPVQPVRRRYVKAGDTALIVLPHNAVCRDQQIAGLPVWVRIDESHAELDPAVHPGPVRLRHSTAGIYRDPVECSLYILRTTGERRAPGR